MDWFRIFILGMATWRLSSLLVREEGPWNIFRRLREYARITYYEDGSPLMVPDTLLAGVLSCVWCCSIWVAAGLTIFWLLLPAAAEAFYAILTVSAVAIFVDGVKK